MHRLLASRSAATAASIAAAAELAYADGPFRLFASSFSSTPASSSSSSSSSGGFDPESLERRAKALRKINSSPHAKLVFDVMRKHEETRLAEMADEKEQYQAVMAQKEVVSFLS